MKRLTPEDWSDVRFYLPLTSMVIAAVAVTIWKAIGGAPWP